MHLGVCARMCVRARTQVKAEPSEASASPPHTSPQVDESDPIYKAMMAAAANPARIKQEAAAMPRPGDRALHHATHDPHAAIKSEHKSAFTRDHSPGPATVSAGSAPPPAAAAAPRGAAQPARRGGIQSMFGDEEEEGTKRRVLVSDTHTHRACFMMRYTDDMAPCARMRSNPASPPKAQAIPASCIARQKTHRRPSIPLHPSFRLAALGLCPARKEGSAKAVRGLQRHERPSAHLTQFATPMCRRTHKRT